MDTEKVLVLSYADKKDFRDGMSERCYWCGRGEHEVDLCLFRMKWGRDVIVNHTCKECFKEYSELGKVRNKKHIKKRR